MSFYYFKALITEYTEQIKQIHEYKELTFQVTVGSMERWDESAYKLERKQNNYSIPVTAIILQLYFCKAQAAEVWKYSSSVTFRYLKLVVLFVPQAALFSVHNLLWILFVWTVRDLQTEVGGWVRNKIIAIVRTRRPSVQRAQ